VEAKKEVLEEFMKIPGVGKTIACSMSFAVLFILQKQKRKVNNKKN
jgi:recombinational DNA repair protein RecR